MPSPRGTRRTGRRVALLALVVTLAVLAGTVIFLSERLREWWHIQRLGSTHEATRLDAAAELGEMRSLRAVPRLLELVAEEDRERGSERTCGQVFCLRTGRRLFHASEMSFTPLLHALHAIGPKARPLVERELERLEASRDPWPVRGAQDGGPRVLTQSLALLLDAWEASELEVRREEYTAPCAAPITETYLPPGSQP